MTNLVGLTCMIMERYSRKVTSRLLGTEAGVVPRAGEGASSVAASPLDETTET